MRTTLCLAVWAAASIVLGQDRADAPPPPSREATAADQAGLLAEWADHHEEFGNVRLAKRLRAHADVVLQGQADELLDERLRDLATLQGEVAALRKATGRHQKVVLSVKVLEVERDMLKSVDADADPLCAEFVQLMKSIADRETLPDVLMSHGVLTAEVDRRLAELIPLLKQQKLIKELASPHLLTICGQPAFFSMGGEFPILLSTGTGAPTLTYRKHGTQVDFFPESLGGQTLKVKCRVRLSAIEDYLKIQDVKVPMLGVREVDTSTVCESGQTIMLTGGTLESADQKSRDFWRPRPRRNRPDIVIVLVRPDLEPDIESIHR